MSFIGNRGGIFIYHNHGQYTLHDAQKLSRQYSESLLEIVDKSFNVYMNAGQLKIWLLAKGHEVPFINSEGKWDWPIDRHEKARH